MGESAVDFSLSFWETMVNTWFVMFVLVVGARLITRRLAIESPIPRPQHATEVIVQAIHDQISEMSGGKAGPYVPFVGTLFLFILTANLLSIIPSVGAWLFGGFSFYHPPAATFETTVALALCAFVAVPVYAVSQRGIGHWLKGYLAPTPIMLPFNILGDITRTMALAVRLFGNLMSGVVIGAVLLSIAPFVFPVIMQLFGLLTGSIQAYIFAMLTMVYIASAVQVSAERAKDPTELEKTKGVE